MHSQTQTTLPLATRCVRVCTTVLRHLTALFYFIIFISSFANSGRVGRAVSTSCVSSRSTAAAATAIVREVLSQTQSVSRKVVEVDE